MDKVHKGIRCQGWLQEKMENQVWPAGASLGANPLSVLARTKKVRPCNRNPPNLSTSTFDLLRLLDLTTIQNAAPCRPKIKPTASRILDSIFSPKYENHKSIKMDASKQPVKLVKVTRVLGRTGTKHRSNHKVFGGDCPDNAVESSTMGKDRRERKQGWQHDQRLTKVTSC